MTIDPDEFDGLDLEEDIANLKKTLDTLPEVVSEQENFQVLAKQFFDLPPKTSTRTAEMRTGIRRKRIRKILDEEVIATDEEVAALTDFIMSELNLLHKKRQRRVQTQLQGET